MKSIYFSKHRCFYPRIFSFLSVLDSDSGNGKSLFTKRSYDFLRYGFGIGYHVLLCIQES